MGGHQIPATGPTDEGWDEDGYDESQRAEIIEATQDGPSDGTILTDIPSDLGDDEDDADELVMVDDEIGEEDEDVAVAEESMREDDIQADFDDEDDDLDEELDDGDNAALEP